jgi:hypothetical protein
VLADVAAYTLLACAIAVVSGIAVFALPEVPERIASTAGTEARQ